MNIAAAYSLAHANPTSLTPAQIVALGTAATAAQLTAAGTDDSSAWTSYAGGYADQSNAIAGSGVSLTSTSDRISQTFRAGRSGSLGAVTLSVRLGGLTTQATVDVEIYAVDGAGVPTGAVLATSTAQVLTTSVYAATTFVFPSPSSVVSGSRYAFAARFTAISGFLRTVEIEATLTDSSYPDGQVCASVDSGASWAESVPAYDLVFSTAVSQGAGQAAQLFRFDYSPPTSGSLRAILARAIAYAGDTTGAANTGATLSLWNASTLAWVSQGTTSAGSGDSDGAKTISTVTADFTQTPTDYLDSSSRLWALLHSSYAGTGGLGAQLVTDRVGVDVVASRGGTVSVAVDADPLHS